MANRIGQWVFDADGTRLVGEGGERRLEDRAARTLALLCERRGEVVSRDDILAAVWNGRAVSENSVAVVMRDLRKALDDDARQPRFIETVAKRGYRLSPDVPARWRLVHLALAGSVLAFAAIAAALLIPSRPSIVMAVTPIHNETGQDSYEPLSLALTQVVIDRTARLKGVTVSDANARLRLDGRLILWNGVPALSLTIRNSATGHVVWTGMAEGGEDVIAKLTAAKLAELQGAGLDE